MSFVPEEKRPKLKAKRFSKFESSARISVANTLNDTGQERQRLKRKNEETFHQEVTQSKKKISQLNTQPSGTKNLANNRLQKLKEFLKADLGQDDSKNRAHSPEKAYKIPLLKSPANNSNQQVGPSPIQENKLYSTSVSQENKNIYTNLNKWASPSVNTPVKNNFHHGNYGKFQAGIEVGNSERQDKHNIFVSSTHGVDNFAKETSFSFDTPLKKTVPSDCNRTSQSGSGYNKQDEQLPCSSDRYQSALDNYSKNRQNRPRHTRPDEHASTPVQQASTVGTGTNIYKNLDKWASPPDKTPQKNIANSRLQRLKNVVRDLKPKVNDTCAYTPEKTPETNNSEQKYRSPLLRDKDTAIKRKSSESDFTPSKRVVINPFSSDVSTLKRESCFQNSSLTPTQTLEKSFTVRNVSISPNELSPDSQCFDKKKNSVIFLSSEHLDETTTHFSCRGLQIQKENAQINSSLNASVSDNSTFCEKKNVNKTGEASNSFYKDNSHEKNTNSSTPVSKRINLNRNQLANTKPFSNNSNSPFSDFKLPFASPQPQGTCPSQSTRPLAENSDNFNGKMAMTASWIRNHQNLNHTQSEVELETKRDINSRKRADKVEETQEDDFEMEWTNAEPDDEIVPNYQDIVRTSSNVVKQPEVQKQADEVKKQADGVQKQADEAQNLCIVVDTNVFISGLSKIKDIIAMKVSGPVQPILYIPWMVITELDFMKHDCSDDKLKQKVSNAVKFINTALKEKNPRFVGQTVYEMDKQKLIGKSPDDKIMSCCLQAAEKYKTVILLSNDINLKSKAMINGVTACSANEIIMKIVSKVTKNTKAQKIMQKMSILCSSVICECAKETYGEVWSKMDLLSSPPWSLVECLKRFKKYWGSVFRDKLMKQFTKTIDDLVQLFNANKYFGDDSEDFITFMKLCVNICIFLKDIEEFRGSVENTLTEITKLG